MRIDNEVQDRTEANERTLGYGALPSKCEVSGICFVVERRGTGRDQESNSFCHIRCFL